MAQIPLRLTSWYYDEESNRVIAKFENMPTADEADPAGFRPYRFFTIDIVPENTESETRAPGGQQ